MRIIKDSIFRITRNQYFFAVYAWVNGDYNFFFASDNYYVALDFFSRLHVSPSFIAKISYDELPENYKAVQVG